MLVHMANMSFKRGCVIFCSHFLKSVFSNLPWYPNGQIERIIPVVEYNDLIKMTGKKKSRKLIGNNRND